MAVTPTLRDALLPVVDQLRQLPALFGLRRYSVVLRTRTWSGAYPGEGTATVANTVITPQPKVRLLSTQEVASSGGTYQDGDFLISSVTPQYTPQLNGGTTTGGYTPAQLHAVPASKNQDVAVIITGDDSVPVECQAVQIRADRAFRYELVVRLISPPTRG